MKTAPLRSLPRYAIIGIRGGANMPTISMFYGIIILMYNSGEHNPPHFHASYQGYNAVFDFEGKSQTAICRRNSRNLSPHGRKSIRMN